MQRDDGGLRHPDSIMPLPTYWPIRGRHYGERIELLPVHYSTWALDALDLSAPVRSKLLAVSGSRVMANDQREGR